MSAEPTTTSLSDRGMVNTDLIPADVVERVRNAEKGEMVGPRYPYPTKLKRDEYEAAKKLLQIELLKMQAWVRASGEPIDQPRQRIGIRMVI